MSDRTLDLLAELVRLVKKYGPAEFARLSALLGDPTVIGDLRTALDTVAKAVPARPEKQHAEAAQGSRSSLDSTLEIARATLMSQAAYPHLDDLTEEAQRLGARVPATGFRSRKDAVRVIIAHLQRLAPEAMAAAVKGLRVEERRSSLEQWSDIIMNRGKP